MGPEGSINHHCPSFHKHGSCFLAPVRHSSAAALVSLSVTSLTWSLHLITISLNSHLFAIFFLCCQRSPVVFVQREYIGSCLNLVCAVLHLVLSEKSFCVCAEGIYRILSEFSLCCSSFGAVREVLLCFCRGNI
jgi:hypothetical protein